MIYFVQAASGPVKIGYIKTYSFRFKSRMGDLQRDNYEQLYIINLIPGSIKTEAALHRKYYHLRIKGEWFMYSEDMRKETGEGVIPEEELIWINRHIGRNGILQIDYRSEETYKEMAEFMVPDSKIKEQEHVENIVDINLEEIGL
jgi:hypothetical protein